MDPQYELLTRDEAADALRVHVSTIGHMTRRGQLPAVRVGKRVFITRAAIQAHIRGEEFDPLTATDGGGQHCETPSIFNGES